MNKDELIKRSKDVFNHPANAGVAQLHASSDGCFFTEKNFLMLHTAKIKKLGTELETFVITRVEALGETIKEEVKEITGDAKQAEAEVTGEAKKVEGEVAADATKVAAAAKKIEPDAKK